MTRATWTLLMGKIKGHCFRGQQAQTTQHLADLIYFIWKVLIVFLFSLSEIKLVFLPGNVDLCKHSKTQPWENLVTGNGS